MSETDYKTIRVPKGVYDDAKERKEGWGVTWGDYVSPHKWHSVFQDPGELDNLEERAVDSSDSVDIDRLESSLETIEERTGRIERQLDELQR